MQIIYTIVTTVRHVLEKTIGAYLPGKGLLKGIPTRRLSRLTPMPLMVPEHTVGFRRWYLLAAATVLSLMAAVAFAYLGAPLKTTRSVITNDSYTFNSVDKQEKPRLVAWLSQRYRVSSLLMESIVESAYRSGDQLRVSPYLILAVAAIESAYNPYAESKVGVQGLMQVLPEAHPEKLIELGVHDIFTPSVNIRLGTLVLAEYIKQLGSHELALKKYVGSINANSDNGYGEKVLEEQRKIEAIARQNSATIKNLQNQKGTVGSTS